MNIKLEILITIIGGLFAIFKWTFEYTKQKKWEKNKFLLDKLEEFHNLESTKIIHNILDWNSVKIKLFEEYYFINDNIFFESLKTHNKKHQFTKEEKRLRELYDEYFDNLTKFVFMTKNGLIDKQGLNMFMGYWFNILSGKTNNKSLEVKRQIMLYLDFYNYNVLKEYIETERF